MQYLFAISLLGGCSWFIVAILVALLIGGMVRLREKHNPFTESASSTHTNQHEHINTKGVIHHG